MDAPIVTELPSVTFSKSELAMLWNLLNAKGIVAPLPQAHVAAELYSTVQTLAQWHGLPVLPPTD
jgi:hypothetical protein